MTILSLERYNVIAREMETGLDLRFASVKAIVFDLDGTLYNEADFVLSGFEIVARYISAKYGRSFEAVFTILASDFNNGLRRRNFDVLLEKLGLANTEIDHLVEIYREHKPAIRLYPDAEATLKALKGRFKLGLITDGPEVTQENKISALDIKQYFDSILITDSLGEEHRKPSERPFKAILDMLGVSADAVIHVGDNPLKDFVAAKKLGLFTVRVRRGEGEYDSINADAEYEADRTIPSLLYLDGLLGG